MNITLTIKHKEFTRTYKKTIPISNNNLISAHGMYLVKECHILNDIKEFYILLG